MTKVLLLLLLLDLLLPLVDQRKHRLARERYGQRRAAKAPKQREQMLARDRQYRRREGAKAGITILHRPLPSLVHPHHPLSLLWTILHRPLPSLVHPHHPLSLLWTILHRPLPSLVHPHHPLSLLWTILHRPLPSLIHPHNHLSLLRILYPYTLSPPPPLNQPKAFTF